MEKKDEAKNPQNSAVILRGTDKMDRRDFFIATGKRVIPTLGILGLALYGFTGRIAAADCNSMCSGGCQGACTGCTGSCSGTCNWTCVQDCQSASTGKT